MEGVTPGPWHVAEGGLGNKVKAPTVYHAGDDLNYVASFADFMTFHGPTRNLENARYIATCSPDRMREVLALARQAEALQRENAGLREALSPSGETKAAYIGEFRFPYTVWDPHGEFEITHNVAVPWTTIKEIMAAIRARALLGGSENAE